MSKDEINKCPVRKYEGPIHVIRTVRELAAAGRRLGLEAVLGFDTETRPAYRKGESYPPSLLQLAGETGVYIFQLKYLGLPGPLLAVLASSRIVKTGVSLDYDVAELTKLADFKPAGFVDIGKLAKEAGVNNHGLRGLAAVLLGFRISKTLQKSNWAKDTLTPAQIKYAATDAWVGRELYKKFRKIARPLGKAKNPWSTL